MKILASRFLLLTLSLILLGAGCVSFGSSSSKKATTSGPAGFFLSTDKGEAWKTISLLPTAQGVKSLSGVSVYSLVEDRNDNKTLYWLSRDQGLIYSNDDGASWNRSVEPLNTGFVYSIAIHAKDNCTIFATNGRQVFKTTDCIRSWTEMYREGVTSRSIRSLAINPFPPYEVYVLENNGVILKSLDGGTSWQIATDFKTSIERMTFDYNQPGLVYLATKDIGLFRSKDAGATWVSLKAKLAAYPGALQYRRLHVYPTQAGQIYWISKFGILFSKNAGEDWDAVNLITPPGGTAIYAFAVNPKNEKEIYYTSTIGVRSTFYKTSDGGKNWVTRKLPSAQIPVTMRVHPENPNWLYLGYTIPPQ